MFETWLLSVFAHRQGGWNKLHSPRIKRGLPPKRGAPFVLPGFVLPNSPKETESPKKREITAFFTIAINNEINYPRPGVETRKT